MARSAQVLARSKFCMRKTSACELLASGKFCAYRSCSAQGHGYCIVGRWWITLLVTAKFFNSHVPKQGALLMARAEFAVGTGRWGAAAAAAAAAAADAGVEALCAKPGTALLADGEARCAATTQVLLSKRHVCVKPVNILLQRRGGRCKRHFVVLCVKPATGIVGNW